MRADHSELSRFSRKENRDTNRTPESPRGGSVRPVEQGYSSSSSSASRRSTSGSGSIGVSGSPMSFGSGMMFRKITAACSCCFVVYPCGLFM